jgi:hypothetical protein
MTLRYIPSALATLAFAAVAGVTGAVPAHAGSPEYGEIQLTITHNGPIFTDNNGLGYDMVVTNNGPNAATHVVVRTTGWDCEADAQSKESCKPIPDRFDPTKAMDFTTDLGTIPAHGHAEFSVVTTIPDENAGFVRTTTEVVSSDQYDTASAPGACDSGWQPQPDCMSDVVDLSK